MYVGATTMENSIEALQKLKIESPYDLQSHSWVYIYISRQSESESHSVVSDSLRPRGLYSPWNSLGQNTGVGRLSLL